MDNSGIFDGIVTAFQKGGPWMVAILLAMAFSLAFTIERFIRLFFQYSVNGRAFMFEVQKYVLANDLDGAIRLCNGSKTGALPRVLKAGLQRASRTEEQIRNAVEAVSLEVIPKLERRLPYLSSIANVATLLGLLGTITGLIRSFKAVELADAAQRQAILSLGISEAMNATAFGLVTAVFTMVAYSILSSKASRIIDEVDEFGAKLVDLLGARKNKSAPLSTMTEGS